MDTVAELNMKIMQVGEFSLGKNSEWFLDILPWSQATLGPFLYPPDPKSPLPRSSPPSNLSQSWNRLALQEGGWTQGEEVLGRGREGKSKRLEGWGAEKGGKRELRKSPGQFISWWHGWPCVDTWNAVNKPQAGTMLPSWRLPRNTHPFPVQSASRC